MSLIIDGHREYLRDPVRLAAYVAAIRRSVHAQDVVADVAAGTGILGLLACQAGASRVYAIERSGMVVVSSALAAENGFADRFRSVRAGSDAATLPEPVDGVVTDQIGHFGFEAGLFEILRDVRRYLKPAGWIIPNAIELVVAPVEDADIRERLAFWERPLHGLDLSAAAEWAVNTGYPKHLGAGQLLGAPCSVARVESRGEIPAVLNLRSVMPIEREGLLDGIAGWFVAELAPGVSLTNSPLAPARVRRRNLVLPVGTPIHVRPGDSVDVRVQIRPADLVVSWNLTATTADGERRVSRSTLRGMLMTLDQVRRLDPSTMPRLTERGQARRTVLELCDGVRSLAVIDRETYERHRALFSSPADASVFVAEVVSRYSE